MCETCDTSGRTSAYIAFSNTKHPVCPSFLFDRRTWWYPTAPLRLNCSDPTREYSMPRWRHRRERCRVDLWIASRFPWQTMDTTEKTFFLGTVPPFSWRTWSVCLIKPSCSGSHAWYLANITRPTPQQRERIKIRPNRLKNKALEKGLAEKTLRAGLDEQFRISNGWNTEIALHLCLIET